VVFTDFCKWSEASAKMWLWVMIVAIKTLNHHQMIHICVDVVIATSI
jgi:hypothetical protein